MKFNKLALALVLAVSSTLAIAGGTSEQGAAGGLVIGGVAAGFAGSTDGSVSSNSVGNAATAAQIVGSGFSTQSASSISGGTATMGGMVTPTGVEVGTSTTNYSKATVKGFSTQAGMDSDGNIVNGGAAFGSTDNTADATGKFKNGAIGGIIAIGGIGDLITWNNSTPSNNAGNGGEGGNGGQSGNQNGSGHNDNGNGNSQGHGQGNNNNGQGNGHGNNGGAPGHNK